MVYLDNDLFLRCSINRNEIWMCVDVVSPAVFLIMGWIDFIWVSLRFTVILQPAKINSTITLLSAGGGGGKTAWAADDKKTPSQRVTMLSHNAPGRDWADESVSGSALIFQHQLTAVWLHLKSLFLLFVVFKGAGCWYSLWMLFKVVSGEL